MDIKKILKIENRDIFAAMPKSFNKAGEIEAKTLKQKLILLAIGLSAALLVFAVGCIIVPISELFAVSGVFVMIFRLLVIAALAYAYFFGYESIHAHILKSLCGDKCCRVNTHLRLFYTTSKCSFTPKAFFVLKLTPTLLIFIVLLILQLILPDSLFWMVYIIQIINLSCAAPYYCLAAILIRSKKKKILICESEDSIILCTAD